MLAPSAVGSVLILARHFTHFTHFTKNAYIIEELAKNGDCSFLPQKRGAKNPELFAHVVHVHMDFSFTLA